MFEQPGPADQCNKNYTQSAKRKVVFLRVTCSRNWSLRLMQKEEKYNWAFFQKHAKLKGVQGHNISSTENSKLNEQFCALGAFFP